MSRRPCDNAPMTPDQPGKDVEKTPDRPLARRIPLWRDPRLAIWSTLATTGVLCAVNALVPRPLGLGITLGLLALMVVGWLVILVMGGPPMWGWQDHAGFEFRGHDPDFTPAATTTVGTRPKTCNLVRGRMGGREVVFYQASTGQGNGLWVWKAEFALAHPSPNLVCEYAGWGFRANPPFPELYNVSPGLPPLVREVMATLPRLTPWTVARDRLVVPAVHPRHLERWFADGPGADYLRIADALDVAHEPRTPELPAADPRRNVWAPGESAPRGFQQPDFSTPSTTQDPT